jgi:hypothetical protein
VRENRTQGSVRGASGNWWLYLDYRRKNMDVVLDFEKRLMVLDPIDDDFPYLVDELLDSIDQNYHQDLIPSIFKFFEENSLNDCGMPGTLVHFVEYFDPFYLEILIESIKRKPSYNTILMTNRILNSDLNP